MIESLNLLALLVVLVGIINIAFHFSINQKLKRIMSAQERLDALLLELDAATNDIANKLSNEINNLDTNGVTQESLDKLQALSDHLKSLGADASDPIPAPPATTTTDDSAATGDESDEQGGEVAGDKGSDAGTGDSTV